MQDQIDAVSRRLGLEEREGRDARVLVASQTYDTSVEDLWDAVTNAERIPRWFTPVSGELRLGGATSSRATPGARCCSANPPSTWP